MPERRLSQVERRLKDLKILKESKEAVFNK